MKPRRTARPAMRDTRRYLADFETSWKKPDTAS
jgi:hypothetical protein